MRFVCSQIPTVVNHIVFTSYLNDPSTVSAPLPWLMIVAFKLISCLVLGSCFLISLLFLFVAKPGDSHYSRPQQSLFATDWHWKKSGTASGPPCLLLGQEHPPVPHGDWMCQWVHYVISAEFQNQDSYLPNSFYSDYFLTALWYYFCRVAPVPYLFWGSADQPDSLQLQWREGWRPLQLPGHSNTRQSQTLFPKNNPQWPRSAFPAGHCWQYHTGPYCEGSPSKAMAQEQRL